MDVLSVLSLVVSTIVAIWGIYQTRVTSQLQQEIHRLRVELDQSLLRLHRARELVSLIHQASFWMIFESQKREDSDVSSKLTANLAELKALALVIGDEEFKRLVESFEPTFAIPKNLSDPQSLSEPIRKMNELMKETHGRIYQLLESIWRSSAAPLRPACR